MFLSLGLVEGGEWEQGHYQQSNNSASRHLTIDQSHLFSFCKKGTGLGRSVECCGYGVYLDFTKALNQIAHDIHVDMMEKYTMSLLE